MKRLFRRAGLNEKAASMYARAENEAASAKLEAEHC
jgi:hypothetical protein